MTMTAEEREDLAALIRDAVADATCAQCGLTPEIVRGIVTEEITEMLGEHHATQHAAWSEFMAFWSEMKKEIRNHFLKVILTFITLAFVAGVIFLIRREI